MALTPPGKRVEKEVLQASVGAATSIPTAANPATANGPSASAALVADDDFLPMREARALFEADYVTRALERSGGNVTRASEELGLSRFMVQKKIKDYGLRSKD